MAPLLKQIESQIGSGPLVISAVWFPPSERVTATSVAQVDNKKNIVCENICHKIVLIGEHIKISNKEQINMHTGTSVS